MMTDKSAPKPKGHKRSALDHERLLLLRAATDANSLTDTINTAVIVHAYLKSLINEGQTIWAKDIDGNLTQVVIAL